MTAAKPSDALAKMREPFPPEAIGKLPRVTCKDCSDRDKNCQRHTKKKCPRCHAYVSEAHVDLDFVGHAALTDRLLDVDPEWNWRPMGVDEHGLPLMERDSQGRPMGLWIYLSVAGVERPGYGSCAPNKPDAVKELIGDALRNAGMRFGAALDLWHKGDLPHGDEPEQPARHPGVGNRPIESTPDVSNLKGSITSEQQKDIAALLVGEQATELLDEVLKQTRMERLEDLSAAQGDWAVAWLTRKQAEANVAQAAEQDAA